MMRQIGLQHTIDRIAECRAAIADLPSPAANVTVLTMYTLARFLQLVGLTIPPLAIIAQLNERITLGQMLGFLVAAMSAFSVGHLLQRYFGERPS
jgi:hypothetical protein